MRTPTTATTTCADTLLGASNIGGCDHCASSIVTAVPFPPPSYKVQNDPSLSGLPGWSSCYTWLVGYHKRYCGRRSALVTSKHMPHGITLYADRTFRCHVARPKHHRKLACAMCDVHAGICKCELNVGCIASTAHACSCPCRLCVDSLTAVCTVQDGWGLMGPGVAPCHVMRRTAYDQLGRWWDLPFCWIEG